MSAGLRQMEWHLLHCTLTIKPPLHARALEMYQKKWNILIKHMSMYRSLISTEHRKDAWKKAWARFLYFTTLPMTIYRIVYDGENWYLVKSESTTRSHIILCDLKKIYKKHLTLALFIVIIYLHRNTIQKLLLKFESCRKTSFLSHITWCTLLTALRYFSDNLTYKYVYNASHMAGGLEE